MTRQCYSHELVWRFEPLLGKHQLMTIRLSGSNHSWSSLLSLSRIQLERLDLPRSIEQISLYCGQFTVMPGLSFDLFGDQMTLQENTAELIDNLNARLGVEALSRPTINAEHPLTIVSGPERLCGNWWQSQQQRDYYLACDSKGARYWIFRESTNKQWFVHGLFA